jgi:HPt (histidine-containing phosphotransfer) domain-containing protein
MSSPEEPQPSTDAWDFAGTMSRLAGDDALFDEVARYFLEDSAACLTRLEESAARDDQDGATAAAHSLLGLAATFGARRAMTLAGEIESAARRGESPARPAVEELRAAVDALSAALCQRLRRRGPTNAAD